MASALTVRLLTVATKILLKHIFWGNFQRILRGLGVRIFGLVCFGRFERVSFCAEDGGDVSRLFWFPFNQKKALVHDLFTFETNLHFHQKPENRKHYDLNAIFHKKNQHGLHVTAGSYRLTLFLVHMGAFHSEVEIWVNPYPSPMG